MDGEEDEVDVEYKRLARPISLRFLVRPRVWSCTSIYRARKTFETRSQLTTGKNILEGQGEIYGVKVPLTLSSYHGNSGYRCALA